MPPSPAASAPAGTATPSPAPTSSAAASDLATRLQALAQATFADVGSRLVVSTLANQGTALVSNNGGGVIANNGGSLISDNGGGLISDNGGGIIANNGGSLTSKTKFQLLDLTALASPPPIPLTAQPGETALGQVLWVDGASSHLFVAPSALDEGTPTRIVYVDAHGRTAGEGAIADPGASGPGSADTTQTFFLPPDETYAGQMVDHARFDPTTNAPISDTNTATVQLTSLGVRIEIAPFLIDPVKFTASFTRRILPYGLAEQGTVSNVPIPASLALLLTEPMDHLAGEATISGPSGTPIYSRRQAYQDDGHVAVSTYDLLDGYVLTFQTDDRLKTQAPGTVTFKGQSVGTATSSASAGGVTITITLTASPGQPIVAHLAPDGVAPAPASPGASAAPGPGFDYVETVVGKAQLGATAVLDHPVAIAVRDDDTFFLSDAGHNRVCEVDYTPTGWQLTSIAGSQAAETDGAGASAALNYPEGLALFKVATANDSLIVADGKGATVRLLHLDDPTHPVTTLAGTSPGFADGDGTTAQFRKPAGVCVGDDGTIYVADEGAACIRKITHEPGMPFDPAHMHVATLAGQNGVSGSADGDGTAATFTTPHALAFDAAHHLVYVGDRDGHAVRTIDVSDPAHAPVHTLVGPGDGSLADGPVATASMGVVAGIGLDPAGNVLVTDWQAKRIRLITPDGRVRSLAGTAYEAASNDGPAQRVSGGVPWGLGIFPRGGAAFFDLDSGTCRILFRHSLDVK